ncbi:hypothetical protein BC826DRAFT_672220 [Russula brevipes]|nr:hypothetical protein BC826DRAFT_672220 [Russula brevipes]
MGRGRGCAWKGETRVLCVVTHVLLAVYRCSFPVSMEGQSHMVSAQNSLVSCPWSCPNCLSLGQRRRVKLSQFPFFFLFKKVQNTLACVCGFFN